MILGTDTRISGYMIRSALAAGITSMGIHIDFVGVLPTPGVSYLTRHLNADAGIMISASHNPVQDNGIKIFSQNGYKLPDSVEEELESFLITFHQLSNVPGQYSIQPNINKLKEAAKGTVAGKGREGTKSGHMGTQGRQLNDPEIWK